MVKKSLVPARWRLASLCPLLKGPFFVDVSGVLIFHALMPSSVYVSRGLTYLYYFEPHVYLL